MEPFLHNHQYNKIVQQAQILLSALQTSSDRRVVEAARSRAVAVALEACPEASEDNRRTVERVGELRTAEDVQAYIAELQLYTRKFPLLSEQEAKRLFPKTKKLKLPDLAQAGGKPLTYLSWVDGGSNRMYLVYRRDAASAWIGVEGRFEAVAKKGVCAFCNRSGETALFTAVTKARLAHLPDYYKAVGQYICLDGAACNARIASVETLEQFLETIGS
ncbi:FusB/FusC family EF-G-binding protein [Paenibacillus sp.]|uniref:FusB/FusC family EF-G-binding protein n=1 Tax=Paenibacillus sp. TaxID=58172 RepID=UPI002D6601AF|nr:FusB/FusC family EF-G-binding protein [Paenibacillus sp.]HZG85662.1 FusB/FusC family EF-G-binding protein [Paenibacillus sp.]